MELHDLIEKWRNEAPRPLGDGSSSAERYIAVQAYDHGLKQGYEHGLKQGADNELDECLKALKETVLTKGNLFGHGIGSVNSASWQEFARMVCIQLHSARRSVPRPSSKEALNALAYIEDEVPAYDSSSICANMRDRLRVLRQFIESSPD